MTYLEFLLQWYNWPYLVAVLAAIAGAVGRRLFREAGVRIGAWLGLDRVTGHIVVVLVCGLFGLIGLTINGALHDYWPSAQEAGFLPGLAASAALAVALTRAVGRAWQRHFPEIRALGFGSPELTGMEGRVVSRRVDSDYRAGRAQVMADDGTLHMALCKTRASEEEIPYGARVRLGEYDTSDGRYFVRPIGETGAMKGTAEASSPDRK